MTELTSKAYLILTPEFGTYSGKQNAVRFNISGITKGKPSLKSGQTAVEISIVMDSAAFEEFIPTITAHISPSSLVMPVVEVVDQGINANGVAMRSTVKA